MPLCVKAADADRHAELDEDARCDAVACADDDALTHTLLDADALGLGVEQADATTERETVAEDEPPPFAPPDAEGAADRVGELVKLSSGDPETAAPVKLGCAEALP
jgi:hypothetical protein